ncbi:MAG: 3-oxo-4-pregnene-20-carboxyl-CoA dehydrogenase alpha subunit [Pseudonocardiales bacterium]|nr:3-oxo-4-pregnene-20-carboxyl-CoA dehydrogenase alpha subunit [Pseudonocardiales bacterium]
MDFTLDETQQAVAELAATVLRHDADHGRVEQALAAAGGYDQMLWKSMAQAGLLALALPQACGGEGFGPVEVHAVLAEVGRQTLPIPALATLSLGVLPVAALGSPEQQQALLPEVADGRILTGALRGPSGTVPHARPDGTGHVLTGTAVGVPYAAQAHRILVTSDAGVFVLDPGAPGMTLTRTPASAHAPEYTVRLDDVRADPDALLTHDARSVERFALAGAIAVADGVMAGALALTAAHVKTREQFGRPLAAFQAVAGQVADVYIVARTVALAAVSANWRLAEGLCADDDLDVAAWWLAEELPRALQTCHHLHGGLGVDITYPLHRYYSHGKDLARFVGGAAYRLDRMAAACTSN